MLLKTILTAALVASMLPLEPGARTDLPALCTFVDRVRVEILGDLDRVRADLKTGKAARP